MLNQRDEYFTEAEKLRRCATPRPNWKRCAHVVPGNCQLPYHYAYIILWNEFRDKLMIDRSVVGKKSDHLPIITN